MTTRSTGSLDFLWANWWRVGGVAGILFLVLFMVGVGIQGERPFIDDPVAEIQDWFADNAPADESMLADIRQSVFACELLKLCGR